MKSKIESPEPLIVRYLHDKAAKYKMPVNVTFELTSRCNFSCKMCYVHNADCNKNKPYELTKDEWIGIAEEVKKAGCIFLLLTGGEPFIRDDFCQIYEALAGMGFVISINTNLSLLTDEILNLLTEYKPNRINVSLYGTSNETYNNLCCVPAFETVDRNIKRLKNAGIPVKVNSSITPFNADDLQNIMNYCDENELVFKGTGYMFPGSRIQGNSVRLSPEKSAEVRAAIDYHIMDFDSFAERTDRIIKGIAFEKENDCLEDIDKETKVRCRAGSSSAWIDWKGNVSSCGMIPADENLSIKDKGFDCCWQEIVRRTSEIRMPEKCVTCGYKHICNICAASAYCETGSFDRCPDYLYDMCSHIPDEYKKLLKENENEA